jgi:hypothetical protein
MRAMAALPWRAGSGSLFQIRFEPEAARVGGAQRVDPL